MLPFVLHLLGDLLEIGSRSCELRRLSVLQQDFQDPQRAPSLRTSSTLQMLCIDQVLQRPTKTPSYPENRWGETASTRWVSLCTGLRDYRPPRRRFAIDKQRKWEL